MRIISRGFGAEVLAAVSEALEVPFQSRRLARPDTYPPFNYINQLEVFPDLRRVLNAAAELCDLDVSWEERAVESSGLFTLEAVGSSPADQTVSVVEWKVAAGDAVVAGDLLADCEADKATFELRAPVGGVIRELLPLDQKVAVGTPIARIAVEAAARCCRSACPPSRSHGSSGGRNRREASRRPRGFRWCPRTSGR